MTELAAIRSLTDSTLRSRVVDQIRSLAPDVGVSVFFGYILRKPLLDLFPSGVVNLHPA